MLNAELFLFTQGFNVTCPSVTSLQNFEWMSFSGMMGLDGLNSITLIHDKRSGQSCLLLLLLCFVHDLYTFVALDIWHIGLQSGMRVRGPLGNHSKVLNFDSTFHSQSGFTC